ncbi:MAG: hypothetical protein ACI8TP_005300, partial [Acidimicrobiales bacterium]
SPQVGTGSQRTLTDPLAANSDGGGSFGHDRQSPIRSLNATVPVREGRSDRGLEDLEAFGAEDLVEGVDELAAAVTHERLCMDEAVGMTKEQVAGCLCGPRPGGVGGDACEEHFAAGDVDEEQ